MTGAGGPRRPCQSLLSFGEVIKFVRVREGEGEGGAGELVGEGAADNRASPLNK